MRNAPRRPDMDQWEIESPHLFGPDIGTSAALFAAGQNPGRVRSVIVGSGAVSFPLQIGGALKDLVEAPDLAPIAALDPRDIVAGSLDLLEKYELSPEAREDYLSSYEGDRFAESCRYVRSYDTDLPVLGDLLPEIQTPVLVLQGDHDPYVPPVNGEYLHERLPNSRLHEFDAGHFFWEDAGDEFAALASAWVDGQYEAGARTAGWDTSSFESTWCPTPGQLEELRTTAAATFGRPASRSPVD